MIVSILFAGFYFGYEISDKKVTGLDEQHATIARKSTRKPKSCAIVSGCAIMSRLLIIPTTMTPSLSSCACPRPPLLAALIYMMLRSKDLFKHT